MTQRWLFTILLALVLACTAPTPALANSAKFATGNGWNITLGGGLGLIGSEVGISQARDSTERSLYYAFQALSLMAMGYGVYQVYGTPQSVMFEKELNLLDLSSDQRQAILKMYYESKAQSEKFAHKVQGLTLVATSLLLFAQSTSESHVQTQTMLGVASGLCLLGGLTLTF